MNYESKFVDMIEQINDLKRQDRHHYATFLRGDKPWLEKDANWSKSRPP